MQTNGANNSRQDLELPHIKSNNVIDKKDFTTSNTHQIQFRDMMTS